MSDQALTGFLNVDKPIGLTSHDVVARVRRLLKQRTGSKKVGHAGTLDPLATGVLVLCIGAATRLSEYVMRSRKTYRAQVRLGASTDTYDAEGTITGQQDASHITREAVQQALAAFTGTIEQVPPMYSAVKRGGRKLYELAREGKSVQRQARQVTVYTAELVEWSSPDCTLEIQCSAGTYIRSIAHDLGQMLGTGAYLTGLRRLASGSFHANDSVALDDLLQDPDWPRYIVPPGQGLHDWPQLVLSPDEVTEIRHGRTISREPHHVTVDAGEAIMAFTPDNRLLALLTAGETHWKPHKVFIPQN